jgi:hypothetical protein
MKKEFEVKAVTDEPRYGRKKENTQKNIAVGAAGAAIGLMSIITASCGIPVVGMPAIDFSDKSITTLNAADQPIPGLRLSYKPYGQNGDTQTTLTDASGKTALHAEARLLPIDVVIEDVDGAANGDYAPKTIKFDDEEAEVVVMDPAS